MERVDCQRAGRLLLTSYVPQQLSSRVVCGGGIDGVVFQENATRGCFVELFN